MIRVENGSPYSALAVNLLEQTGMRVQTEEAQIGLPIEQQIGLLRDAQLPINQSTANHIYGHYDWENDKEGLLNLSRDAQGELFQKITLSLFEMELSELKTQGEEINPSDFLRSLMTNDEGVFDPRFDEPIYPPTLLRRFERYVEEDLLTEEESEECISVWIEPYSPEFHDQVAAEIQNKKQKEAERDQWYKDSQQYIDNPDIDFDDVPEHLRDSYLRQNLATIAEQEPERARQIFHSLTGKEPLKYIHTLVDRLVAIGREEETMPLLNYTREEMKKIPVREYRLARNRAAYARYGKGAKQERKPKLEADAEGVFALLHPHALVGDLEGMTEVFDYLDSDNFQGLCTDLGVTPEQFDALLIWTFTDEYPHRKMGDRHNYYDLQRLLSRSYKGSDGPSDAQAWMVELYGKVLERRIQAFGEGGIGLIPTELVEDKSFVYKLALFQLQQGNSEAAKPWIKKLHQLTSSGDQTYYKITNLLSKATEESNG